MFIDFRRVHEDIANLARVLDDKFVGGVLVSEVSLESVGFGSVARCVVTQGTSEILGKAIDVERNCYQFTRAHEVALGFLMGISGSSFLEHTVTGSTLVTWGWAVVIHRWWSG